MAAPGQALVQLTPEMLKELTSEEIYKIYQTYVKELSVRLVDEQGQLLQQGGGAAVGVKEDGSTGGTPSGGEGGGVGGGQEEGSGAAASGSSGPGGQVAEGGAGQGQVVEGPQQIELERLVRELVSGSAWAWVFGRARVTRSL